jgi:antitoxin CcdA
MLTVNEKPGIYRRPVNLTVDTLLLDEAKALGIPLSSTFEQALRARVEAERARRWLEENAGAIEDYNARVEKDGSFGSQFGNI